MPKCPSFATFWWLMHNSFKEFQDNHRNWIYTNMKLYNILLWWLLHINKITRCVRNLWSILSIYEENTNNPWSEMQYTIKIVIAQVCNPEILHEWFLHIIKKQYHLGPWLHFIFKQKYNMNIHTFHINHRQKFIIHQPTDL